MPGMAAARSDAELRSVLKSLFGYSDFRGEQLPIIKAALRHDKPDIFVIMPTGGGKSLCYQVRRLQPSR